MFCHYCLSFLGLGLGIFGAQVAFLNSLVLAIVILASLAREVSPLLPEDRHWLVLQSISGDPTNDPVVLLPWMPIAIYLGLLTVVDYCDFAFRNTRRDLDDLADDNDSHRNRLRAPRPHNVSGTHYRFLTDVKMPHLRNSAQVSGVSLNGTILPEYRCNTLVLGSGAAGWRVAVAAKWQYSGW